MQGFAFRGLKVHGSRMWRWESVRRALEFMRRFNMTSLIFYQSDLLGSIVQPRKYLAGEEPRIGGPTRALAVSASAQYLRRVLRAAKARGIDVYLEVDEIEYPDALLEKFPDLCAAGGKVCATDPFWFAFLRDKTDAFAGTFPDIAGLIVSPESREAKVSFAANRCDCARCESTSAAEWYARYIKALYEPLSARGMRLIVRDLSDAPDVPGALVSAARECSDEIVIGHKSVPHGFWPTYPHNPGIARADGTRKWVECDAWGRSCGLGVLPASLVEDIAVRFAHALRHGCEGVWLCTDWHLLDEASSFNSFNIVNLIAGAMLAKDIRTPQDEVYRAWLEYGLLSSFREESTMQKPVRPTAPGAQENLSLFMQAAYEVIRKSLYVFGHVFNHASRYQSSYQSIRDTMEESHRHARWGADSMKSVALTEANLHRIFAEKRQAVDEAKALSRLVKVSRLGLPESFAAEVKDIISLYPYYCEGFEWSARVYFRLHKAITEHSADDARLAEKENDGLKAFIVRLKARLQNTFYPYYVYWMMDTGELEALCEDVARLAVGIR